MEKQLTMGKKPVSHWIINLSTRKGAEMSEIINTVTDGLEQLVIFTLAGESYGVSIGTVSGIERIQEVTKGPRTADYVEGVINLRGRIIPVVDLRKVFYLPLSDETKDTRIVVMDIGGKPIGCLVDEVTEVLRIPADSVEPPSSVITSSDSHYLLGIAKLEDRMIILLDLDKLFSSEGTSVALAEMKIPSVEEISSEMEATAA